MGRKRRKVVVTVTETWTFVFDETGEAPLPAPHFDPPALASIPTPPLDAALSTADAPDAPSADEQESSSASEHGV
jgi:hypothetical protein